MRRNNKQFVYTVIVTTVVGLAALMVTMLWGVRYISASTGGSTTLKETAKIQEKEKEKRKETYTTDLLVLVTDIRGNEMNILDINSNQRTVKKLSSDIKVTNEHGKIMPLDHIKAGDIVKLVYIPNEDKIAEMHISDEIWELDEVVCDNIDFAGRTLTIRDKVYDYIDYVFVQNEQGERVDIKSVGSFDKLHLRGVGNRVWSIRILEKQSSLALGELPSSEGILEINRNTMIPLTQIEGPIPIPAGKNKIVISMTGYKPIVKEISVQPGENYELLIDDAQKSYTKLRVIVTNTTEEYFITINNQTYSWDRTIELEHGDYAIEVSAAGHKTWRGRVLLEDEIYTLKVALEPLESDTSTSQNGSTDSQSQDIASQLNKLKTVKISTEPSGADVFVKGVKQGQTPLIMNLPSGSYTLTFSKEGYETYTTTILVEDNQSANDYFYMLTVKQQ